MAVKKSNPGDNLRAPLVQLQEAILCRYQVSPIPISFAPFTLSPSSNVGIVPDAAYDLVFR
jgi:hypothetical protein